MAKGYEGFEALWHDLFWEAEDAPSEVPLMDEFLEQKRGQSLYIGSGSGRLLGPLVEFGHDLVGLELSPEMVALSKQCCPEAKVIEQAWQQHEGQYGSILIPAFTFQLFPDPQKQLQRLGQQTNHLYLTLFFPWAELSGELPQKAWYFDRRISLPEGLQGELETWHQIKESTGSLRRRHRYTLRDRDGQVLKREETEQRLRFFTDVGLKKLFSTSGWEIKREIVNLGDHEDGDLVYVSTFHLEKVAS
jgi:hypothetical protein